VLPGGIPVTDDDIEAVVELPGGDSDLDPFWSSVRDSIAEL